MYHKKNLSFVLDHIPAVVSGLMLTAAFPDTGAYYLAFVALVPLLVLIRAMTPQRAFYAGFVAGFIHYLTLIYWLVPTITIYGGLHPLLGISTLTLLCLYLALYVGVFAFLMKRLDPSPVLTPLAGAFLWVGLEYIRTYALTGFPWGVLGYSQDSNLTLVQIADLTGVLGLSFLIVLCNGCLAQIYLYLGPGPGAGSRREIRILVVYTLVLMAAALAYGNFRVRAIDVLILNAAKPKVSVIQGNIRQDLKWDTAFKEATIEKYGRLSLKAAGKHPELIIWPETALPFYYGYNTVHSNLVDGYVRLAKTHFLIGSPAFEQGKENPTFYNRVYLLTPLALVTGTYDKTHLVPFGEYVPLQAYLKFLGKITEQAGDFSAGERSFVPLAFKEHKTGVLICFEILFPNIASQFVKNGADILTTITNDAWFGHTSAARQHFSIAVLRAVENRRSVVRAANTGISGVIDPAGRILEKTNLFVDAAITQAVPALKDIFFYSRHGDLLGITALVAICLWFMVKGIKNPFRRTQK
ncbi:MAG: apolipoprotein N-acyltransferase [Proteobacteria bacterium]|nr:apolipoprotein N-acyltransferase [Pseudomonadota bacterium]